jgi:hypothetical protein
VFGESADLRPRQFLALIGALISATSPRHIGTDNGGSELFRAEKWKQKFVHRVASVPVTMLAKASPLTTNKSRGMV